MNKERRDKITKISDQLSDLRTQVEELRDEEQDSFDNMPESFQQGEKGQQAEGFIENLNDADNSLQEAIDQLGQISE